MKNIELIEVGIDFNIGFTVKEKDYDSIMKPIDEIFLSAGIITKDNKDILPKKILYYMSFKHDERYMIREKNITYRFNYIIVDLRIGLLQYLK